MYSAIRLYFCSLTNDRNHIRKTLNTLTDSEHNELFSLTPLRMKYILTAALLCSFQTIFSQSSSLLKGKIVDASGDPIIGAAIQIPPDYAKGTVSDIDGNFQVEIPVPEDSIKVSYIGYKIHMFVDYFQ